MDSGKRASFIAAVGLSIISPLSSLSAKNLSSEPETGKQLPLNGYTSSSYLTDRGANLFLYGDILYLTAREEGLEFAAIMDAPSTIFSSTSSDASPVKKTSFQSVDFDWHVGFRLGGGWHLHHDYWDLSLEWMHYNHQDHRSLHPDLSSKTLFVVNVGTENNSQGSINNHMPFAEKAKELWNLDYNTLDLALAKSFWLTDRLSLTPHIGFRSAWIDQTIDQIYENVSNPHSFVSAKVKNKNRQNFWGIGLRAGLYSRWVLTNRFSLFGNFSFCPLYSDLEIKYKMHVKNPLLIADPLYDVKDDYWALKCNTDLQLGVQWDFYFSKDAFHLGLRAAWEYHLWLNQNQINRFDDRTVSNFYQPNAFYKAHGNLSLYGASLGIVFDF